jgi:kynureninase
LRFGLTPLYVGYADVWHAVRNLKEVMTTQEWQQSRFSKKQAVT